MFSHLTPVVQNLVIINVLVFICQYLFPAFSELLPLHKTNWLHFWESQTVNGELYWLYQSSDGPSAIPGGLFKPYQVVSTFFAHGSVLHIAFNMLALTSLGPPVEYVLGGRRFLEFYLFSGVVGAFLCAVFDPSPIPVLGASGAISGVMLAFGLLYPNQKLMLMFIPYPIPARSFVIGFAGISLLLLVADIGGNISHFGHLAGMAAALIYLYGKSWWIRLNR
jgi:membrane associated rhomboid family serine protease